METRAFRLLEVNRERVASREELIRELWPEESGIYHDQALSVHIRNIRRKLGKNGRVWIKTIRQQGYRLIVNEGHDWKN